MQELSKSQKARLAIRTFKTIADAMVLRGMYRPGGKSGSKLVEALKGLGPEIYGSMADPRIVELKGLEYVIDRMPRGIESCTRIVLTAQEDFHGTSFTQIVPAKRRRISYAVSDKEMCFVITRGLSEIYDVLTHITFLQIEANKVCEQIVPQGMETPSLEFQELERVVNSSQPLDEAALDHALWNLSIILGRTYQETRESYLYLEKGREANGSNSGLFHIIYAIGTRIRAERLGHGEALRVYFTPSLRELLGQHAYATVWAKNIKEQLYRLGGEQRPVHVISANLHSVPNSLYGAAYLQTQGEEVPGDLYAMIRLLYGRGGKVLDYAKEHGLVCCNDSSGCNINAHLIDTAALQNIAIHPAIKVDGELLEKQPPLLLVFDYAFGTQAFEVMDELLCPLHEGGREVRFQIASLSIMGKAGILPGEKGDIMLATAHVMEGTPHNYIVANDLTREDFASETDLGIYVGPMVTVLGTSLQNRAVLEKFQTSSWKAIGLEMEGAHYQRAISAAIIQGHIEPEVKTRYAYYASDNPLLSGQTLASGPMGEEGIVPTYLITRVFVEKILNAGKMS